MVKVAVILASYNGEKYIEEQIKSIKNQVNVQVDIFLRDDRSSDKTVSIANRLLPVDRIIINDEASGSAANNFLRSLLQFENAGDYEYFAFADQDDIWLPEKLDKAIKQMTSERASLYFSNLIIWNNATDSRSILKKDDPQRKFDYLFEGGSAGCTYVFDQSFFKALKNKVADVNYLDWPYFSHDWFTYFCARILNLRVINSSDAEILYRIHDCNVYGQLNTFSWSTVQKRIKMLKNGWYLYNAENYARSIASDSEEFKIYRLYCKNFVSRLRVCCKYNFSLMRNRKKFLMFATVSMLLTPYSTRETYRSIFNAKN